MREPVARTMCARVRVRVSCGFDFLAPSAAGSVSFYPLCRHGDHAARLRPRQRSRGSRAVPHLHGVRLAPHLEGRRDSRGDALHARHMLQQ